MAPLPCRTQELLVYLMSDPWLTSIVVYFANIVCIVIKEKQINSVFKCLTTSQEQQKKLRFSRGSLCNQEKGRKLTVWNRKNCCDLVKYLYWGISCRNVLIQDFKLILNLTPCLLYYEDIIISPAWFLSPFFWGQRLSLDMLTFLAQCAQAGDKVALSNSCFYQATLLSEC